MKTSDMRESKFLKQSDVGTGVLFTIQGIEKHNVAHEGADPEMKFCLTFAESEKPLVVNSTNLQLCESIFGSDETDDWLGKKIVLYSDPNVSYQGKLVGGIRVRAPRVRPAAPQPAKPVQAVRAVAKPAAEVPVELEPEYDAAGTEPFDDETIPF